MQRLTLLVVIGVLAAVAPSAVANGNVERCSHVRGFYEVTVRNMTCHRAAHILWHARGGTTQIEGYRYQVTGHGPSGGFPAEAVCIKGSAHARGWVIDGPA